jgi:DNA-binding LytR/AlgR family response regulator
MRIAICDDNEIQIGIFMHRINNFLKRNGDIKALITPYDKGQPLIDDVADGEWYDIVVLDIVLREENGIEVAKELRLNGYDGNIIFWTAHKEYVFDALDILPVHYIIKGSEDGRMYGVVNRELENIHDKTLTVKNKDYFHRVDFCHIEYIESRNKYITIHCTCGITHMQRGKLSDVEKQLDRRFLRCHQSYIVNMDEVWELRADFRMVSGDVVPIRRKDLSAIRKLYEGYIAFK